MEAEKLGELIEVGVVGIDSGQLMLTDPCYIEDQWKNEDEATDLMTVLDAARAGEEIPAQGEYSYSGACAATANEMRAGQLNYRLGHEGAGVVTSTGYGDGVYPVFVQKNEEGRVLRLIVEFGDLPGDLDFED